MVECVLRKELHDFCLLLKLIYFFLECLDQASILGLEIAIGCGDILLGNAFRDLFYLVNFIDGS